MARLARAPDGSRFAKENTARRAPEGSTDGDGSSMSENGPGLLRVVVGLLCLLAGVAAAAADEARCQAPERVCAVRDQVFRIASFDPVGSAVLVEAGLLVTNRHVIADRSRARVFLSSGRVIEAFVVPTSYPGDLVLLRADGLKNRLAPEIATAEKGAALYTVGTDLGSKRIRVYPPGGSSWRRPRTGRSLGSTIPPRASPAIVAEPWLMTGDAWSASSPRVARV